YEKAFRVMVSVGKKRYAARWWHFKGKDADADGEPEIKGLEYKRGDSARLGRRLQEEVVKMLLTGEAQQAEVVAVVERYRDHLMRGELAREDVVLSKRLSKSLRDYAIRQKKDGTDARSSPHVEVARALEKLGRDVGQGVRIEYVVVDADVDPPVYAPAEAWSV